MFELNDQGNSQSGGLEKVIFYANEVMLEFSEATLFLAEYEAVSILLAKPVDVKLVDFFVNYLYLGDRVVYDNAFEPSMKVAQTKKRDYL